MTGGPDTVAARLADVRARLADACQKAGRDPASVTLIAVSKGVEAARCREATLAGQKILGENYAQELRDKAPQVPGATWHFIGPLQRNKVKYAVGTAALLHAVDSEPLLEEIAARAARAGIVQRCLVQVNVARELKKAGCPPEALAALVDAFARRPQAKLDGLMCIPPQAGDPVPHFRALRELANAHGLSELSMGMSADYERAIAEGATLVRVGTAIFGERARR